MGNLAASSRRCAIGKYGIRAIECNKSSQICGSKLARPEFRTATFSVYGRDVWVEASYDRCTGTFSERKADDSTGCFQSSNARSCDRIVTDCSRAAHFCLGHRRPMRQRNSDHMAVHIFGRSFCISRLGLDWPITVKSANKANCGTGAAVDIGVIGEHFLGFIAASDDTVATLRGGFTLRTRWEPLFAARQRRHFQGRRMILSANLPRAAKPQDAGATNRLRRSLIKMRCRQAC